MGSAPFKIVEPELTALGISDLVAPVVGEAGGDPVVVPSEGEDPEHI